MSTDTIAPESRSFEAHVAQLLQLMVHLVYSDRDVFLRELISNAVDACERLRFEAIANPALLGAIRSCMCGGCLSPMTPSSAFYLRFVRGLDSYFADLPLNVSREMIQESPILGAIKKGGDQLGFPRLEKLAQTEAEVYAKVSVSCSARCSRRGFMTTSSGVGRCWSGPVQDHGLEVAGGRSPKDYAGALRENQTAIYDVTGSDLARLGDLTPAGGLSGAWGRGGAPA